MIPKELQHVDVGCIYIIPDTERSWFAAGAVDIRSPKKDEQYLHALQVCELHTCGVSFCVPHEAIRSLTSLKVKVNVAQ